MLAEAIVLPQIGHPINDHLLGGWLAFIGHLEMSSPSHDSFGI